MLSAVRTNAATTKDSIVSASRQELTFASVVVDAVARENDDDDVIGSKLSVTSSDWRLSVGDSSCGNDVSMTMNIRAMNYLRNLVFIIPANLF